MLALKNKRGDVLIWGIIIMLLALFFMSFIVDFGKAYVYKVQAQSITDAAVMAGANEGKHGFMSMVKENEKRAEVLPTPAKNAANKVINANKKNMPNTVTYSSIQYNKRDKRGWNSLSQYLNGDFTIDAKSSVKTTFLRNGLNKVNIPFLRFKTHAKMHIEPR